MSLFKKELQWVEHSGTASRVYDKDKHLLVGYRFEPTSDGSACYPTKHGSWETPKLPLVLDWKDFIKP